MEKKLVASAIVLAVIAAIAYWLSADDPQHPRERTDAREDAGTRARALRTSGNGAEPNGEGPLDPATDTAIALERFARQVEIVSRGEAPTTITPAVLREALTAHEVDFFVCVREAGGMEALRAATQTQRRASDPPPVPGAETPATRPQRTAPTGPRPATPQPEGEPIIRRTGRFTTFDVRPDGTVDPESIAIEPPVPEPFTRCFHDHVSTLRLPGAGAQGTHIEMPLGPPRQRILPRNGDAGVPPI